MARVQVTVSDDVLARWRESAKAEGISLSAWVTYRVNRSTVLWHRVLRDLEGIHGRLDEIAPREGKR